MFLFLFLFWIVLNGKVTAEIIIFGLCIGAVILLFMCKFMDYSLKKEMLLYRLAPEFIHYFFILLHEIFWANVGTIRLILDPRVECESQVFHFTSPLKSRICQVILANSITLTPGTITVKLDDDGTFVIHCLDPDLAEGIDESVFVKKLRRIEAIMEKAK